MAREGTVQIVVEPRLFDQVSNVIQQIQVNISKPLYLRPRTIDYARLKTGRDAVVRLCPSEKRPYAQNGPVREAIRNTVTSASDTHTERSDLVVFYEMRAFANALLRAQYSADAVQLSKLARFSSVLARELSVAKKRLNGVCI